MTEPTRPERLIYLLDANENRHLRCEFLLTRLLNWKNFQPAPIIRITEIMQSKYRAYLRDEDRRLVMRLAYWESVKEPVALVGGAEAYELLRDIVATGRAFLRNGNQLALQWGEERLANHRWAKDPGGSWSPALVVEPESARVIAAEPPCYLDPTANSAGTVRSEMSPELAAGWASAGAMSEEQARAFCLRLLNRFPTETIPLPGEDGAAEEERIPPRPCLRVLRGDSVEAVTNGRPYSLNDLARIELWFFYGPRKVEWNAEAESVSFEEKGRVRRCVRDRVLEEQALAYVRSLGFVSTTAADDGFFQFDGARFHLSDDAPVSWSELLNTEFPRMRREMEWLVEFDPSLNLISSAESKWFSQVKKTREDWFSFEAGIVYQGKSFSALPIIRLLLRENRTLGQEELLELCRRTSYTVPIEGGEYLLLPGDRIAALLKLLFKQRFGGGENLAIRMGACEVAELAEEGVADVEEDGLIRRLRRLRREAGNGIELSPTKDLPDLPIAPRDYQLEGLAWLDFLREYELGGVLADDMGLGKTMQVLIHLLREKVSGRLDGPCLIVAPTSVIDSWENEQERFTPGLNLLRFHGTRRKAPEEGFSAYDVVITSYDLTRVDADLFGATEWSLIVLDEAQRIKNADSVTARALCSLSAKRRLCLTGTPLENHLGELWSLFHFLMPGFLGARRTFADDYRKPVEGDDPELAREAAELLSRRLRPFILRRKKDEVAKELPPRTEVTRLIPLSFRQAELYESVRLRLHRELASELERRGVAGSQIQIFDALMKLRQICCDPRLHKGGEEDLTVADSAKLSLLMEMVGNLLEEGRSILIFSQFVSMLRLIGTELEAREWKYLELTGETTNRGRVVEAFQAGEARIFLLSLKAGGAGLNLTAADTVIQYDPWWNPAVERQAADRAYRIGQDKPVFQYRLIAKGTVEEKILSLQERKQAIIDGVLAGLPANNTILDEETFEALFEGMEVVSG